MVEKKRECLEIWIDCFRVVFYCDYNALYSRLNWTKRGRATWRDWRKNWRRKRCNTNSLSAVCAANRIRSYRNFRRKLMAWRKPNRSTWLIHKITTVNLESWLVSLHRKKMASTRKWWPLLRTVGRWRNLVKNCLHQRNFLECITHVLHDCILLFNQTYRCFYATLFAEAVFFAKMSDY